jgi:hypothetical protein
LIRDVPPGGDRREIWVGPDVHFITGCLKNAKEFTWKVTHKDIADVEEGWVLPGKVEDALKVIEGWDPILHEVVKVLSLMRDLTLGNSTRTFIRYVVSGR